MLLTVPVLPAISTKLPSAKGWVISSVRPAKILPSTPCTDRESARPATLSSATSEAVGIPSSPAMMTMAMTQSSARTSESRKRFMV